jgi:hypothetical protein
MARTDLLQGTLDLLVLRILALGPNHGWGISIRIRQMSKEGLTASQGSLYPSLHRLELGGYVVSEMTPSENNRKALSAPRSVRVPGRIRATASTDSPQRAAAISMKTTVWVVGVPILARLATIQLNVRVLAFAAGVSSASSRRGASREPTPATPCRRR